MKRIVLTFVIVLSIGFVFAQNPVVKIGATTAKAVQGVKRGNETLRIAQKNALPQTITTSTATTTPFVISNKASSQRHLERINSVVNCPVIQLPEASTVVREMYDSIGKGKKMRMSNLPSYYFYAKKLSNINSKESSVKMETDNVH